MVDKLSSGYTESQAEDYLKITEDAPATRWLLQEVERLAPGKRVLDYGCGFGRSVPTLLKAKAQTIFGFDPTKALIEEAMRRFPPEQYPYVRMASDFDTFESERDFDVIITNFVLHYPEDTAHLLRKLASQMRIGATIIGTMCVCALKPGDEGLENTPLRLRLSDTLTVDARVKTKETIAQQLENAGFAIQWFQTQPDSSRSLIDSSDPHKEQLTLFTLSFKAIKI